MDTLITKKPVRLSLVAQLINEMEQSIIQGLWPVGERIPSETELMEQFGVSRNTLREAMQSLTSLGLIEVKQGFGTVVLSQHRFDAMMKQRMDEAHLVEILETRIIVESELVKLAALRRTAEDVVSLRDLLGKRNRQFSDVQEFIAIDTAFHLEIARQSYNQLLFDFYKSLFSKLESLVALWLANTNDDNQIDYHNILFKCIEQQNGKEAKRVVMELVTMEMQTFAQAGLMEVQTYDIFEP